MFSEYVAQLKMNTCQQNHWIPDSQCWIFIQASAGNVICSLCFPLFCVAEQTELRRELFSFVSGDLWCCLVIRFQPPCVCLWWQNSQNMGCKLGKGRNYYLFTFIFSNSAFLTHVRACHKLVNGLWGWVNCAVCSWKEWGACGYHEEPFILWESTKVWWLR